MKFYIAAPMSFRDRALDWARILENNGHDLTARWVTNGEEDPEMPQAHWANMDLADIHAADVVILMTGVRHERLWSGGRHFEFGYAYHLGKRCIVCGQRESVFHHLERIEQYDIIEDVAAALNKPKATSPGFIGGGTPDGALIGH